MRINCDRCNSTATIQSTSKESELVKKLYCTCKNPDCGHSFVMMLSYSHTISPSLLDFPESIKILIQNSAPVQQKELFKKFAENI